MPEEKENKMATRRENRVAAMQFLYMREVNRGDRISDALEAFYETKDNPREYYRFTEELVAGVEAHQAEIDKIIKECATNWTLERIARVDLAILRLAIFELLHREDIPPIVSINEAIDLAKTFSSGESRRFINGVLDSVKGRLNRPLRTPKI